MRWVLVSGILLLLGIGAFFFAKTRPAAEEPGWRAMIEKAGPEKAYAQFAESVAAEPPGEQHTAAHNFGDALYEEKGLAGLSACDSRFGYGCFHQLVGRVIAEHGLGAIAEIQHVVGTSSDSNHGVGHGILAYLGYTLPKLKQALAVCPSGGTAPWDCSGGVFMEYNFRTMLGEGPRLPGNNPYAPCDALEGVQKTACTFWLPEWWDRTTFGAAATSSQSFANIGAYCDGLPKAVHGACYGGIGYAAAAATEQNAEVSTYLCNASTANTAYRTLCNHCAAYVFTTRGKRPSCTLNEF